MFFVCPEMTKKLTKSEREQIIFSHLKGNETPGYEVIEEANGKYTVRALPQPEFEIEEEEDEPQPVTRKPNRTKQNARELLRQLSELLDSPEDPGDYEGQYIEKRYKPGPQNWKRRRLVF